MLLVSLATVVRVSELSVPARAIPVPSSISPEAQAVLSMGILGVRTDYPAPDDPAGWRALVAEQDEVVTAMMADRAAAVAAERERREIGEATVHVVAPLAAGEDDNEDARANE